VNRAYKRANGRPGPQRALARSVCAAIPDCSVEAHRASQPPIGNTVKGDRSLDISVLAARVRDSSALHVTMGNAAADRPPAMPSSLARRMYASGRVVAGEAAGIACPPSVSKMLPIDAPGFTPCKAHTSSLFLRTEELYRSSILGNRDRKKAVKPGKQRKLPAMAVQGRGHSNVGHEVGSTRTNLFR